jgi:hypothetical protein
MSRPSSPVPKRDGTSSSSAGFIATPMPSFSPYGATWRPKKAISTSAKVMIRPMRVRHIRIATRTTPGGRFGRRSTSPTSSGVIAVAVTTPSCAGAV